MTTLEEYKEEVTKGIVFRMMKEVRAHDSAYNPPTVTSEYWIIDLLKWLTPADRNCHSFHAIVRGYGVELHMTGKLPMVIQFNRGCLHLGFYRMQVDCLERAVEDLRFLISVFPKYAKEYCDAMNDAETQMKKDEMIREIYEATVEPAVSGLLVDRGLTCTTRRNLKSVSIAIRDKLARTKTFYINYNNFDRGLDEVRQYITEHYPVIKNPLPDTV